MMSGQFRFVVDTPHGRFGTNSRDGYHALVFKNRNPSAKADVVWLKTEELAAYQEKRLTRLGFDILGVYKSVEQVDNYLTRPRKAAATAAPEELPSDAE